LESYYRTRYGFIHYSLFMDGQAHTYSTLEYTQKRPIIHTICSHHGSRPTRYAFELCRFEPNYSKAKLRVSVTVSPNP